MNWFLFLTRSGKAMILAPFEILPPDPSCARRGSRGSNKGNEKPKKKMRKPKKKVARRKEQKGEVEDEEGEQENG
ncbi:hypothetical protein KM043_013734 [Ampulex compressa]|nr:hypothetical protein KM043_013734 [Ampulex compressa]